MADMRQSDDPGTIIGQTGTQPGAGQIDQAPDRQQNADRQQNLQGGTQQDGDRAQDTGQADYGSAGEQAGEGRVGD